MNARDAGNDAVAVRLRRIELAVIGIGLLLAITALGWVSRDAFQANMAWTKGMESVMAFVLTLASLLFVGAIVVAPYVLLALLGRLVANSGPAVPYRVAGLAISCLVSVASAGLYLEAVNAVTGPGASSTAAVVFVVIPVLLFAVGGAAYGVVIFLYNRKHGGKYGGA